MPTAIKRQLNLLICAAFLLGCEGRAAAASAHDELLAAKLVENAVMMGMGGRRENPTEVDRADIEKLVGIYRELVAKYPQDAEVRNAFANYLWFIGRQPAAISQWETAASIDPKNAETAYKLGHSHLSLGDVKKAVAYLSQASELAPGNALYHLDLGNALYLFRKEMAGDPEFVIAHALGEFRKAAELESLNAGYAKSYAETFYGMKSPDWQEALRAWSHYLDVSANKDFAYSNLARVSLKLGRKKEARDFLAKIEGLDFDRIKGVLYKQTEED